MCVSDVLVVSEDVSEINGKTTYVLFREYINTILLFYCEGYLSQILAPD